MAKNDSLLAVNEILAQYTNDVTKDLEDAMKSTAEDAVAKLKATSPKRRGKYARGWKVKKSKGTYIVHNTQYQLTHLLENGHDIVSWGRKTGHFEGKPHIKPVNDWVAEEVVKRIEDNL